METKRLFLAVGLCLVLFFGWNYLAQYMGWIKSPHEEAMTSGTPVPTGSTEGTAQESGNQPSAPAAQSLPATPMPGSATLAVSEGGTVAVETPFYSAQFHVNGAVLKEFKLKKYSETTAVDSPQVNMVSAQSAAYAPMGLLVNGAPSWTSSGWAASDEVVSLEGEDSKTVTFAADVNGVKVVREITFHADKYVMHEKTRLSSDSSQFVRLGYTFGSNNLSSEVNPSILSYLKYLVFGGQKPKDEPSSYNMTRAAMVQNGKLEQLNASKDLANGQAFEGGISWMGVMNNYFLGAVSTDSEGTSGKVVLQGEVFRVALERTNLAVQPGQEVTSEADYYVGPKETKTLEAAPNFLEKAQYYGWFSFIARPLVWLLDFFYSFAGNYGIAIIILTILIKVVFWPLSYKSFQSMNKMKKVQPLISNIREKHAGDKEAISRETMQLYKAYKINPLGGCLPILVQLPFFFGLYQGLLNAIELRHAPFISYLPFTELRWLADLSAKDPFFITPIVMGLTMFLQQKMTPAAGDPTQAKVMMLMPIIFTFIFLNFPSGLVVYWLVNNVISIAQQWWQLRRAD